MRVEIKPGCLEEYKRLLKADIGGSRNEAGCLRFDVLTEEGSDNVFIICETYENETAFNKRLESAHSKAVREFLDKGGGASEIIVTRTTLADIALTDRLLENQPNENEGEMSNTERWRRLFEDGVESQVGMKQETEVINRYDKQPSGRSVPRLDLFDVNRLNDEPMVETINHFKQESKK